MGSSSTVLSVGGACSDPGGLPSFTAGGARAKCIWISRDEAGRPSCEHGPAVKAGVVNGVQRYKCGLKNRDRGRVYRNSDKGKARDRRYAQSEKGKAFRARWNRTPRQQSSKAMYEVTGRVPRY